VPELHKCANLPQVCGEMLHAPSREEDGKHLWAVFNHNLQQKQLLVKLVEGNFAGVQQRGREIVTGTAVPCAETFDSGIATLEQHMGAESLITSFVHESVNAFS